MRIIKSCRCLLNIRKRFVQCSSGKVGHHKVDDSSLFTVVINGHDVEMLKSCDKTRFALEADEELFLQIAVRHYVWRQYFHGDTTCKRELLCPVDGAHTSRSNKRFKPIFPQYFSNKVTIEYLHGPS